MCVGQENQKFPDKVQFWLLVHIILQLSHALGKQHKVKMFKEQQQLYDRPVQDF